MNKYVNVRNYIKDNWLKAVKAKDCNNTFIMPYDYIPPCVDGDLINLFYWDTFFTNIGLYLDDLDEYAFFNIEDLKFCLNKFGCVPNMCRGNGADYASQPPLLFLMVKDYFNRTKDLAFLESSYLALTKEYKFWMTKRITENGLNRYGTNYDYAKNGCDLSEFAERINLDISKLTELEKIEIAENRVAEGESGEDHTPRFLGRAKYINPIDLNSYLYDFEQTMSEFSIVLNNGEREIWLARAKKRKELINKYCLDKDLGVYFDYDYQYEKTTKIFAVACYLPFVYGITRDEQAIDLINKKLVNDYGVVSCQEVESEKEIFQWGYPNAWAPHQYWAYVANKELGNKNVAKEIAIKYLDNVSSVFEKENKLFEKYDAVKGGKATVNEYGLPEMLGWTAGVYNYFFDELVKGKYNEKQD